MISELLLQRDVLSTLIDKDFKSRYKAKALGRLWSVADPLVMMVVYTIVFVHVFKVGQPFFPIFLLLGLTPYRFFSNCANGAASAVSDNVQLVKKVSFPRILLPIAVVFSHVRHFFIEFGLIGLLFVYFHEAFHFSIHLLWLPLIFAIQLLFVLGVSLIVSALNVRYRDTQYVLNSSLLVLTWLTPNFYKFADVPPYLRKVLMWNPLVGVIEGYRSVLLNGCRPSAMLWGAGTISAVIILGIGLLIFKRFENAFADYV
jgi:ABC-2 type transport system permease protein